MRLRLYCCLGLACYLVLSATDLVYTSALLKGNCEVRESNPIAEACLERHGLWGLAAYKLGGVTVFVGSIALLARRRPRVAAGLVTIGCAALLSVVMYSHKLIAEARAEAQHDADYGIHWRENGPVRSDDEFVLPELCGVTIR